MGSETQRPTTLLERAAALPLSSNYVLRPGASCITCMDAGKAVWSPEGGGRVIVSFGDRATEDLFHDRHSSRIRRYPPEILRPAIQQLDMLNAARVLKDLRSPPGNRLEALRGDLAGFHSIRINRQWRIIFRWEAVDASEVRIVDYHTG